MEHRSGRGEPNGLIEIGERADKIASGYPASGPLIILPPTRQRRLESDAGPRLRKDRIQCCLAIWHAECRVAGRVLVVKLDRKGELRLRARLVPPPIGTPEILPALGSTT